MNFDSRILLPVEREYHNNNNSSSSSSSSSNNHQIEIWEVCPKVLEDILHNSNLRTIRNGVLHQYRVGQSHLDHRILQQFHNRTFVNHLSLWNSRHLVGRKMVGIHHHRLVCLIMIQEVVKKVDSKMREEEEEMVHHHHQVLRNNNKSHFLVMIMT